MAAQQITAAPTKVINNILVEAPNQVQLKVKVAEVHREALKRVGVNWQNIADGSVGVAPLIGAVSGGFAIAHRRSRPAARVAGARVQPAATSTP